ncbi:MAG: CinA family nicotinamide mononucleotide deamidase-related protein [Anaerolineae bacterium]
MQAEIITIGTEILLGQIVDTNAAHLAQKLAEIGLNVYRKTTVGDNDLRIAEAVRSALRRSDVVITSGGLGPTVDDKTREAVAAATNRKLMLNPGLLNHIEEFFSKRGREAGENNRRQAYLPRNAIPIHNPVGTAPGFIVKHQNSYVISLPGVPRELYHLTEESVLPFLRQEFSLQGVIESRILHTAGIGESSIDRRIADLEESTNPTVGLAAHAGSVDIRISAKAVIAAEARQMLDEMEARIRERLGDMIFGSGEVTIEEVVAMMLVNRGLSLAVLETNTAGLIASRLAAVPGGMEVLNQALITSPERARSWLLPDVERQTNISTKVAELLAARIREQAGVDIGVAIVGDTTLDVGPYSERTGNTYISLSTREALSSRHIRIGGVSEIARIWAANTTLDLMRRCLQE